MTEEDEWCDTCGARMKGGETMYNVISKQKDPIIRCPQCRKWEWRVNDGLAR